jgi:hyaluronan synthase
VLITLEATKNKIENNIISLSTRKMIKGQPRKEVSFLPKLFIITVFLISLFGMFYINYLAEGKFDFFLGIYGTLMVSYLLGKMILSFFYKPYSSENLSYMKVSVVIPVYNESPQSLSNTINSILSQDYPIYEIIVVDDGSEDMSGYNALKEMESAVNQIAFTSSSDFHIPRMIVHRLPQNKGKRHAQAWAFKRAKGEIIVTVDSDAYIYPDAIRELIAPFQDESVKATTGHVNARNKDENLFTKLIDMRYDNAFRVERSAQSVTGNILVCSGCFSAYRKDVILDNIEHYETQTFLGEPVQFGDDRCLTNYAIMRGKTIYQSTAHCATDVPSNLRKFLKQQIRWNKSFFRESLIALKIGLKKPKVLIWTVLEMLLWILFGISLVIGLVFKSHTLGWIMIAYYLAYVFLSAYARNVFYLLKHPFIFFLAPLYGLIHLTLLVPLRLYALLTIKQTGWGTR